MIQLPDPYSLCSCGSGRSTKECCIPHEPLISQKSQGNTKIDININPVGKILDTQGNFIGYTKINTASLQPKFRIKMRKFDQKDNLIDNAIYNSIHVKFLGNHYIDHAKLGELITDLSDVLHGIRYHQQNCLYRLRMLIVENSINPNIVETGKNIIVEMQDSPLRYELESFIFKLATCLDVYAKIAGVFLDRKFTADKDFWGFLIQKKKKYGHILELYTRREWIKSIKTIRNSIAHDGSWEGFKAFQFEGLFFTQPKVGERSVGYWVQAIWKDLIVMTQELLSGLSGQGILSQ